MKKFSIEKQELAGNQIIQIKNNDCNSWLSLFPFYGGTTHELVIDGQSILETAQDEKTFKTITQDTFAGMQLFPFPNRIREGKYSFGEESFEFETNDSAGNNALHGFIFKQVFEVVFLDEEKGAIQLAYKYEGDVERYPFKFKLENTYQLLDRGFSVTTTVTNESEQEMPLGHGWHPYFSVGESIENARLQISSIEHYPIEEDYIPKGTIESHLVYHQFAQIGKDEFNHCFKIQEGANEIAKVYFPSKELTVKVLGRNYPYLQVYIPPNRKSIALEPQSCIPDAFNNDIGVIKLLPNDSEEFEMRVEVE